MVSKKVQSIIHSIIIMVGCYIIYLFGGVEQKSWFEMIIPNIVATVSGMSIGALCLFVLGSPIIISFGWLWGPVIVLSGGTSILLFGLVGNGFGGIYHLMTNPSHFNFNWSIIITGIAVTSVTCRIANIYMNEQREAIPESV